MKFFFMQNPAGDNHGQECEQPLVRRNGQKRLKRVGRLRNMAQESFPRYTLAAQHDVNVHDLHDLTTTYPAIHPNNSSNSQVETDRRVINIYNCIPVAP